MVPRSRFDISSRPKSKGISAKLKNPHKHWLLVPFYYVYSFSLFSLVPYRNRHQDVGAYGGEGLRLSFQSPAIPCSLNTAWPRHLCLATIQSASRKVPRR